LLTIAFTTDDLVWWLSFWTTLYSLLASLRVFHGSNVLCNAIRAYHAGDVNSL